MLLVIDIGNTHIVLGVYKNDILIADWRISTSPKKSSDEYALIFSNFFSLKGLDFKKVKHSIISCVVPSVIKIMTNFITRYLDLNPIIVDWKLNTGIKILYDDPKEVGADRIVNAVAGAELHGGPLIIVDFGTATTFDAISNNKEYLGGAISPGLNASMVSLFKNAAKLPNIELIKPPQIIGKNTISSMQSGIIYGYAALVDGIIEKMQEEMHEKVKIIATGGFSKIIIPVCNSIDFVDPFLTLKGLKIIHDRNDK